jgi:hypothetical protein
VCAEGDGDAPIDKNEEISREYNLRLAHKRLGEEIDSVSIENYPPA